MSTKDLRVALCVPTAGMVSAWFMHSVVGLMGYGNASIAARGDATSIALTLFVLESSVVHSNREKLANMAREWNATHVMFLDDDMIFQPQVLAVLLGRRQSFVACNYLKRGEPPTFTAVKLNGTQHSIVTPESTGLEEANYTGFGVSLIEMQVFEKTPQPWFLPIWVEQLKEYTTEDNAFCSRVRAAGFSVFIDYDASKMIGHRGALVYQWQQWRAPEPKPSAEVVSIKGEKA